MAEKTFFFWKAENGFFLFGVSIAEIIVLKPNVIMDIVGTCVKPAVKCSSRRFCILSIYEQSSLQNQFIFKWPFDARVSCCSTAVIWRSKHCWAIACVLHDTHEKSHEFPLGKRSVRKMTFEDVFRMPFANKYIAKILYEVHIVDQHSPLRSDAIQILMQHIHWIAHSASLFRFKFDSQYLKTQQGTLHARVQKQNT